MAPFRSRDRSNRSGRGQVEHNVLEGLPINQYKEIEITIGPNSTESKQLDKDEWPDPPMPRDSHLLPEHSQQILAKARSGRSHKPPAPPEEDKETMDEEEEHKEVRQGFTIKKWIKVPRHLEEPETEYLAKRRKGLPSQYIVNVHTLAQPTPMRETKIKKTDADGNVNVYKVLVPEGQAVEGEVQPTDAVNGAAPTSAPPGTVVEGVGVVNAEGVVVASDVTLQTPARRRPPPPKKKKRSGPGRGKKKVLFVEGNTEQGTPISSTGSELLTIPDLKQEESVEPSEGGDTPMPDAADDDDVSGEEGSDDEDHEAATHSSTPAQAISTPTTAAETPNPPNIVLARDNIADVTNLAESAAVVTAQPVLAAASLASKIDTTTDDGVQSALPPQDIQGVDEVAHQDISSSPELPLSTITHSQGSLDHKPPVPVPPPELSASEPDSTKASTPNESVSRAIATTETGSMPNNEPHTSSGETDLLGSLERQLEQDSESMGIS